MGCSPSRGVITVGGTSSANNTNPTNVEKFLKQESIKALTHFKVLLLGAGESGKSTVIKQLKTIHRVHMEENEINHYKVALHDNSHTMMCKFIEAAQTFAYEF